MTETVTETMTETKTVFHEKNRQINVVFSSPQRRRGAKALNFFLARSNRMAPPLAYMNPFLYIAPPIPTRVGIRFHLGWNSVLPGSEYGSTRVGLPQPYGDVASTLRQPRLNVVGFCLKHHGISASISRFFCEKMVLSYG